MISCLQSCTVCLSEKRRNTFALAVKASGGGKGKEGGGVELSFACRLSLVAGRPVDIDLYSMFPNNGRGAPLCLCAFIPSCAFALGLSGRQLTPSTPCGIHSSPYSSVLRRSEALRATQASFFSSSPLFLSFLPSFTVDDADECRSSITAQCPCASSFFHPRHCGMHCACAMFGNPW